MSAGQRASSPDTVAPDGADALDVSRVPHVSHVLHTMGAPDATALTVAPEATEPAASAEHDRADPAERAKREAALGRVRKFVDTYVAKGKYGLYPEPEVVENVIVGLAENLVAHGRMYCPCADVEDSKTKGSAMVCPCTPHHADIARQGYCDCALFASRDFVATERLRKAK